MDKAYIVETAYCIQDIQETYTMDKANLLWRELTAFRACKATFISQTKLIYFGESLLHLGQDNKRSL